MAWVCSTFMVVALAVVGSSYAAEPMRIELEQFSFEVPSGFEDATNYTFRAIQGRDRLTISFGALSVPNGGLKALMASRRENIAVLPGPANIEGESDARVDGIPARMLAYIFEDGGKRYRDRWVVAIPAPDLYLQISYLTYADDLAADDRFKHIRASVVPARKPRPPAPDGYVRRWAKRMSLDVPTSLAPIASYVFVAKDDPAERIVMVPSFRPGSPVQYEKPTPMSLPGAKSIRQQVDLSNGLRVDLTVQSPRSDDAGLTVILTKFAGSLLPSP